MKKEIIDTVIEVGKAVGGNDEFKSFVCGNYADGSPRSIMDAFRGEVLSPKQRKKLQDHLGKQTKKKKKRKKKKYRKICI